MAAGNASDSDDDDDGVKQIAKQFAQQKEPGAKKISMHTPELRKMLFTLF